MPLRRSQPSDAAPSPAVAIARDDALLMLSADDPAARQAAARALAGQREAGEALSARFAIEADEATSEALAVALMKTGGSAMVERLLPLLSSDEAQLRNRVIEILQALPAEVAPHMERLLDNADPDVRIFAVNVLEALRHPKVEDWLIAVISTDRHVNVVGTALDLLGEVGTEAARPALKRVIERFGNEPFIAFAATTALKRIGAQS